MTTNKLTLDQLKQEFTQLGETEGQGRDGQIKFHLRVVEAAHQQAIDVTKDKHGTDKDDATILTEAYYNARNGKQGTAWDAKAPNIRKARSCVQLCIKLGMYSMAGGSSEPWATVQALMTTRQKLKQNPTEAKRLDDACNTLFKYARAQIKSKQLLDGDELKDFCYKPEHQDRTAEQYVEAMRKTAMRLRKGELPGGAHSDTAHIKTIEQAATAWLKEHVANKKASRAGTLAPQYLAGQTY